MSNQRAARNKGLRPFRFSYWLLRKPRFPFDKLRANGVGKGVKRKPFVLSPSKHEQLTAQLNRDLVVSPLPSLAES